MKHLIFIFLICTLFGCERRPLVYEKEGDCAVVINVNWEQLPIKPMGMSVICYPRGGGIPTIVYTNNVDKTNVTLKEGIYDIVVFNQIPSDFRRLKFTGLDLYSSIAIESVPVVTDAKWLDGIQLHENPEHFASETLEGFEVTCDMIDIQSKATTPSYSLDFMPPKVTYLLKIKINIQNIQNLRAARSLICNLSSNYLICDCSREHSDASHSLDDWELFVDDNDKTSGYITSSIEVFGISDNKSIVNNLRLNLQLRDKEATELVTEFIVNNELKIDEANMVITLNLQLKDPLPDIEIEGDDGGFDAEIGDWEDDIIQDVEIKNNNNNNNNNKLI